MKIKRLYLFMLQTFLPLFCMTFFICLFIILMQFLWSYINDLVGKGLQLSVICELFFYAALTMIPMALPLAILLASLMTFGNLGEHFELTAMKAAGISLLRTMKPLTIFIVFVSIAAFFFQNNVLPIAQTKMWTLLFSMRQKNPEVEIPEGIFYDQIPGYNLFVQEKNRENGMLYNMMIYDMSAGFDNAMVILADSGYLAFTEDKTHIYLKLWQGESFENLRDASQQNLKNVPYRRESFSDKELVLPFDANFNRMDEQTMRSQYVGKDMKELIATIDSVSLIVDSMKVANMEELCHGTIMEIPYYKTSYEKGKVTRTPGRDVKLDRPMNVDSIFKRGGASYNLSYLNNALTNARRRFQDVDFKQTIMNDQDVNIRRHAIELHKKFTLSFACIIFFFIGAPLGAIIRKGGLGVPVVISVILFIFYYIIDNTGYKMAREGRIEVWEGMWLSSAVLLPLGIFLTYKAMNDSAVFNPDAWKNFFYRLLGLRMKRTVEYKEVIINEADEAVAVSMVEEVQAQTLAFMKDNPRPQGYLDYLRKGFNRKDLGVLAANLDAMVNYLSYSRDRRIVRLLSGFPMLRNLIDLQPLPPRKAKWAQNVQLWAALVLFPFSIPLWLRGRFSQHQLLKDLNMITPLIDRILPLLNTNGYGQNQT